MNNNDFNEEAWQFSFGKEKAIFDKLISIPRKLSNITEKILVGLQTSADPIYILEFREQKKKT